MAKVLIVDDSPFMRASIRNILTEHGYAVAGEAGNGAEAVQMYKELKPNAVTLDLSMNDCARTEKPTDNLDGIRALKEIMAHDPEAVVILISSIAGQKWLVDETKEVGAKAILPKPIVPKNLMLMLNQFAPLTNGSEEPKDFKIKLTPELMKIFRRDAEKSIAELRAALTDYDVKRITMAAHAMKGVLASVGENEIAALASRLEEAGKKEDMDYIKANSEQFIAALEGLLESE
jgi:two-component system chemotaxis response regulator CheY